MRKGIRNAAAATLLGASLVASGVTHDQTIKDAAVGVDVQLTDEVAAQLERRTWNSVAVPKRIDAVVTDSLLTREQVRDIVVKEWEATISAGQANFLSETGEWEPIDTRFVDAGTGFEMTKATFAAYLPETADGPALLVNNLRYDNGAKRAIGAPPVTMGIQAVGIQPVQGQLATGTLVLAEGPQTVSYVVYPDAFGAGADLIYYVNQGAVPTLEKVVRLRSAPAATEFAFDLTYSSKPDFKRWDEKKEKTVRGESIDASFGAANAGRAIRIGRARIWDSDGAYLSDPHATRHAQGIDVRLTPTGADSFRMTKLLPAAFLASSTYPVYTDATLTVYPDPNAEVSTFDGWVEFRSTGAWTDAVTAADATQVADDSGTTLIVRAGDHTGAAGVGPMIARAWTLFDASSIDDSATVSSAVVSLNTSAKNFNGDNDATDHFAPYGGSSPASNTGITNADYDQCQSTAFATPIDYTSVAAANSYTDWTMNATGIAAVSLTGVTKICWREGHDATDSAYNGTNDSANSISFKSAETADVTSDPKLVITYSAAARRVMVGD
jgi:hypothetical protein